jgi:hypothetical protein
LREMMVRSLGSISANRAAPGLRGCGAPQPICGSGRSVQDSSTDLNGEERAISVNRPQQGVCRVASTSGWAVIRSRARGPLSRLPPREYSAGPARRSRARASNSRASSARPVHVSCQSVSMYSSVEETSSSYRRECRKPPSQGSISHARSCALIRRPSDGGTATTSEPVSRFSDTSPERTSRFNNSSRRSSKSCTATTVAGTTDSLLSRPTHGSSPVRLSALVGPCQRYLARVPWMVTLRCCVAFPVRGCRCPDDQGQESHRPIRSMSAKFRACPFRAPMLWRCPPRGRDNADGSVAAR